MLTPSPWMILPFVLLLITMAAVPVLAPKWWLKHYGKVALSLGAVTIGYYLFGMDAPERVLDTAHEYLSFVALVGSLFVVSGGIHIVVKGCATPRANVLFLLTGAVLANFLGTTGAAMLLIRPWIRVNKHRIRPYHIVFFIFIVANAGGCLTPVGDPPLFLGYLQGVPFWWVTQHCWPAWLTGIGLLLTLFFVIDWFHCRKSPDKNVEPETWRFDGWFNLFFLAVILGAVFITKPLFIREALMIGAAVASYLITQRHSKVAHEKNDFTFHPVQEVGVLFAGVFATMMPALDWIAANAKNVIGDHPSPGTFYWAAGGLSSVLDNAPTYLGFLNTLSGISGTHDISAVIASHSSEVLAISVGAVFFGAATYIGNGPNFMIKAVAEQENVPVPSFFGFVFRYSLPFLVPVLAVIWFVFFH